MTAPVRVGLVGCGRLAERGYLPALARADGVSLAAVADLDLDRCAAIAPELPAFASAGELLAGAEVQLLILAHAAAAHATDARLAASAGVTALVEKPPSSTAAEAATLVGLGPPVWMAFNRRFERELVEMHALLAAEPAATLELEMSVRPADWDARGGSEHVLLDLGPHVVDLALWLAGPVVALRSGSVTEREVAFELDHGSTRSTVRVSHGRAWRERVVARDDRGSAIARFERGGVTRRLVGKARRRSAGPLVGSLTAEVEAVATAVRGGAVDARLAGAADGVAVMRVLEAVQAAGASGEEMS